MQFARFVGTLGLVFALGLVVGCGSDLGSAAVSKEDGKTIKEQRKQDHQRSKEVKKRG
jgi:hypothetical protein